MDPLLVALSFIGLASGIPLTHAEVRNVRLGLASRDWVLVPGVVLDRRLHLGGLQGGDETGLILYRYEVAGSTYLSNRVDYSGRATAVFSGNERTLKAFPVGMPVEVRVDPHDPSRAVLHPGISGGTIVRLLIGLALSAFGLAMVVGIVAQAT